MDTIVLYNDVNVPVLGIGTFMISPEDTENSVYAALKEGYRMIDTANAYMNEEAVGKALARAVREGLVKREDVFVSTKIWPTLYENPRAVSDTLKRLGLDYVDLLFIHQPAGNFIAGYRQLEKAYREGRVRSLGISNMHDEKLERLLAATEIKPHVIQLEAHPYCTEDAIMDRLSAFGTRLMGWYPLGHGDPGLLAEPVFGRLGDKYHKSAAQIILRWLNRWALLRSRARRIRNTSGPISISLILHYPTRKWRRSESWPGRKNIMNRTMRPKKSMLRCICHLNRTKGGMKDPSYRFFLPRHRRCPRSDPQGTSDVRPYESINPKGVSAAAILDTYNSCMLQPVPTFGAEHNYFAAEKAKCGLHKDDRCIPGEAVLPDGTDVTSLVHEAEDFLNTNSFFQYDF